MLLLKLQIARDISYIVALPYMLNISEIGYRSYCGIAEDSTLFAGDVSSIVYVYLLKWLLVLRLRLRLRSELHVLGF